MNLHQRRNGIARSLIAVFSFLLLTTVASGQSAFQGTFELNEGVRWGDTTLPAGQYSLTIDSLQVPVKAIVRSANGKQAAIVSTVNVRNVQEGGDAILMSGEGQDRQVVALNLP